LPYQAFIPITDGMRHHDDGKTRVSRALSCHLPERGESGADDGDCGNPEVFQLDRVTRGPGCRGTSMADAVDDGVALSGHFLREG
jgi:hypothetical protein